MIKIALKRAYSKQGKSYPAGMELEVSPEDFNEAFMTLIPEPAAEPEATVKPEPQQEPDPAVVPDSAEDAEVKPKRVRKRVG